MDSMEKSAQDVEVSLGATTDVVERSVKHAMTAATVLLTLTFVEDAVRIFKLWDFQYKFVVDNAGVPDFLAKFFLLASFFVQCGAVLLPSPISATIKKKLCFALLGCVVVQPPMYGQLGNIVFVSMSVAQIGALLLLAASCHEEARAKEGAREVPGDWALTKLFARLLLTVDFFVVYVVNLEESMAESLINPSSVAALLLLVSCMLVWIGFKTVLTATALAVAVGMDTVFRFPFWATPEDQRDNIQFHFFQSLSLVGGMLLLAVHGPGRLALDNELDKTT